MFVCIQIVMNTSDIAMVNKYTTLWETGRYLSQAKNMKDDWKIAGVHRKPGAPSVSFEDLVQSSVNRMKVCLLSRHHSFVTCVYHHLEYYVLCITYSVKTHTFQRQKRP